jgi:uncharacterized protein with FMN-binding domain
MKRIVIWLASTVTVVVLLFGYHTSTNSATPASASSGVAAAPSSSASGPAAPSGSDTGSAAPPDPSSEPTTGASSSPSASASETGGSTSAAKTYTGDVAQTRWGPVQVEITVKRGTITAVDVLQHPAGNSRDAEINDYALPILVQDTLTAQSATIDMVSGATVTSGGYVESLQSALDQAGL